MIIEHKLTICYLVLPAMAVMYTIYRVYVSLNKTKRESIFRKHKSGTAKYNFSHTWPSHEYVPVAIIATLTLIANAVRDMLNNTRYPFLQDVLLYITLGLLGSSVALYLRIRVLHSNNKRK